MAEGKFYLAVGEEATRGTAEKTTVGFIPIKTAVVPEMTFNDVNREEFRGDDTSKGATTKRRLGQAWTAEIDSPMFADAGTTDSMVGTKLKHQFGHVTSTQNASTGQYAHMFSVPSDPYASGGGDIDAKALTFNINRSRDDTTKNYVYRGGRGSGCSFEQAIGEPLMFNSSWMGQTLETAGGGTAIASPTYAAENLRFDFDNLTAYTGTITRAGTGPDFTDITFGSATPFSPDNVSISIDFARNDKNVLDGTNSPSLTSFGRATGTLSFTIDLRTAGFDSETEFDNFFSTPETTTNNFAFLWDSGTVAGTAGDNYSFIIDCPECVLTSAAPEYSLETNPLITLEYEFMYNSTTAYNVGAMLKNESATV